MINACSRSKLHRWKGEKKKKIKSKTIFFDRREKNSHPSIMSLICRLKQSDYAESSAQYDESLWSHP